MLLRNLSKLDKQAALKRVIHSPAPYIGMIGSVQKRDVVFEKLRAEGISEELISKVHAPVGAARDLGSDEPLDRNGFG